MPVISHPSTTCTTRPHSASASSSTYSSNIKGQLRCIFSRSRPTTPVLRNNGRKSRNSAAQSQAHQMEYNKVQKAKRKKSTQLGHEEEERVMRILHNLEKVQRRKTPAGVREELTDLYIKPLPEYIQDKIKQSEERQLSRSAILFEELFENHSLEDNENTTSADKIQLPEQKPQTTSRWQQKMLSKLEKMENSPTHSNPLSNSNSTPTPSKSSNHAPHLNRSLQVQGQGSSCSSKTHTSVFNTTSPSRYKPPMSSSSPLVAPTPSTKTKQSGFSYTDPLPYPTTYLHSKENLSPFEERILELEKLERDSILIERTSKPRASNREITTRIPATLMNQPKYLESTAAFQSRISQRRSTSSNGGSNAGKSGRSLTPTNVNGKLSDSKRKTIREKETILQQKRKNGNSKVSISTRS